MSRQVTYSEPSWALLKVDKVYLVWKDRFAPGDRYEYSAPAGCRVDITGETQDARDSYGVDTLYWAQFAGFTFGVTSEEVEFIG